MKIIQIIHNPTAGDENTEKQELLESMNDNGYEIQYFSTHAQKWEAFYEQKADAILIAGGDGTLRKVADVMLTGKNRHPRIPIYLKPIGTANNVAKTLGIPDGSDRFEMNQDDKIRAFECGKIRKLNKVNFFLESVGIGIFPELMRQMNKDKNKDYVSSSTLPKTLDILIDIVKKYKAAKAEVKVDGMVIKGSFLLVEVMNIKYIGPNIKLAPDADPFESIFDLVMIPERKRAELIDFLEKLRDGNAENADFAHVIRTKKVKLKWKGGLVHADDNLIKNYNGKKFSIKTGHGSLGLVKDA